MHKISYLFLLPLILLLGCGKSQNEKDDAILKKYISDHQLNAVAEPNGLYYVETQAGTGGSPTATSTVWVNYTGYFIDGTIFDQSVSGTPVQLNLANTIGGWQEGIPLMKKTGKAKLLVPSLLGYGAYGSGSVPGNTCLIFDVELVNFQ
ncbi:MAG: FKBP-type peptidyl-prolyl cis-trans isomerase [Bacteroidetes bacterium]|nr:FKBP-type peptidyl-prolyl cis-trans isomerase [Bacteroidota bacterium]MBS1617768.1 FKBP-type peptidyl-prolyl cis-trans isomerase [Bacteroidota bacterium]